MISLYPKVFKEIISLILAAATQIHCQRFLKNTIMILTILHGKLFYFLGDEELDKECEHILKGLETASDIVFFLISMSEIILPLPVIKTREGAYKFSLVEENILNRRQ